MPARRSAGRRRVKGEGSVYQTKAGRWRGAYIVSADDGTRKRIVVSGKAEEECRERLDEAQRRAGADPLSVEAIVDAYLDPIFEEHRARSGSRGDVRFVAARLYSDPPELVSALKRELFGEANALGRFVRVADTRLRVIGVMAPKGSILGVDLDEVSAQDGFLHGGGEISSVVVSACNSYVT